MSEADKWNQKVEAVNHIRKFCARTINDSIEDISYSLSIDQILDLMMSFSGDQNESLIKRNWELGKRCEELKESRDSWVKKYGQLLAKSTTEKEEIIKMLKNYKADLLAQVPKVLQEIIELHQLKI